MVAWGHTPRVQHPLCSFVLRGPPGAGQVLG